MKERLYAAAAGVAVFAGTLALIHHLDSQKAARRAPLVLSAPSGGETAARTPAARALRLGDQPQGRTAQVPAQARPSSSPRPEQRPRTAFVAPRRETASRDDVRGYYNKRAQFWPLPLAAEDETALVYDAETADVVGFVQRAGGRLELLDLRGAVAATARPGASAPAPELGGYVQARSLAGFEDATGTPWLEALRSTYEHFNGPRDSRAAAAPRAVSAPASVVGAVTARAGAAPEGRSVYVRARGGGLFDVVLREADSTAAQAWLSISGEQLVRLARAYRWTLDRR